MLGSRAVSGAGNDAAGASNTGGGGAGASTSTIGVAGDVQPLVASPPRSWSTSRAPSSAMAWAAVSRPATGARATTSPWLRSSGSIVRSARLIAIAVSPMSATSHASARWLRTARAGASSRIIVGRPSDSRTTVMNGRAAAIHSAVPRSVTPHARVSSGTSSPSRATGRRSLASQVSVPRRPKVRNRSPSSPNALSNVAGGRSGTTARFPPEVCTMNA